MLKTLITGIDGFTGRYLATELLNSGYEVVGITNKHISNPIEGVRESYTCNLNDAESVTQIVNEIQPKFVVHLAAISFVGHRNVNAIYRTNVTGTGNLLEALSTLSIVPQAVLVASSANVYGNSINGQLDETSTLAPVNDYAVSKLAMECVVKGYCNRLPVTLVRPFNYTGVGQSECFLLPKIVSHVRRGDSMIELGNLHVARDFSDVRVVVKYYRRLLESAKSKGEIFNICSGKVHTLEQILEMVKKISKQDFVVKINPTLVRTNEVKVLVGNPNKLHTYVGKINEINLIDTLSWMIETTT